MIDPAEVLAASPLAGQPGLRWRPGVLTVASPMRQAVDAANWIVEADGIEPVFLKIYEADAAERLDLEAAWAGVRAAAAAGVGPAARFVSPDHRALASTYMGAPWRAAFLHHLAEPPVLAAVIAAKRRLHGAAPLPRSRDVFSEVEALHRRVEAVARDLPRDLAALVAWCRRAAAAIGAAGVDLKPCHNDGSASSLLVDPDKSVLLVDLDQAGQSDPFYDLALTLNEAAAFGSPWEHGVALYAGRSDARLVDRCRVYGTADDVLWGLWGHLLSATSPRRSVEFLKYGEWRLLRARMALREPGFADRLRRL